MDKKNIIVAVVAVVATLVFAGKLRQLPIVNKIPTA